MITRFSVENWKRKVFSSLGSNPREESCKFKEIGKEIVVGVVADGITRDFKDGSPFCKDFSGLLKVLTGKYPNPSPARKAAKTFCNSFYSYISMEHFVENARNDNHLNGGKKVVREAIEFANGKILERSTNLGLLPNPDYLARDLAGCVSSGGVIRGRDACLFRICDCGFSVFNAERGEWGVEPSKPEMSSGEKHIPGFYWQDNFYRRMWREQIRNFPADLKKDEEIEAKIQPSCHGILTPEIIRRTRFGALTGEREALGYVRVGRRELKDGEIVMIHTDGLTPLLNQGKFIDNLRAGVSREDFSGLRRFCRKNVSSEGTLVLYAAEK